MWFKNKDVGLDFVERAPQRFVVVRELAATPDEVFGILADGDSWPRWFPDMREVAWQTPAPHTVGSIRHVRLKSLRAKERFIAWEPGKRWSFVVFASTAPFTRAMVEDYVLEPLPGGHTRLTVNACFEPSLLGTILLPILRRVFGKMFDKAGDGLRDHIAKGAHR